MNYRKSYSDIGKIYLESKLNENVPSYDRPDPREMGDSRYDPKTGAPYEDDVTDAVEAFEQLSNALKTGKINWKAESVTEGTITVYTGGDKAVVIQVVGFD
jgi:hypothetical protein